MMKCSRRDGWRVFWTVAVCACLVACNPTIDRPRADKLAAASLQEYAKQEGLKAELFTKGEVQEFDEKWLYSFDYPAPPHQTVAIIVSRKGNVEVTRMFEENR